MKNYIISGIENADKITNILKEDVVLKSLAVINAFKYLERLIKCNEKILNLSIANNGLDSLEKLDLAAHGFGDSKLRAIGTSLSTNTQLMKELLVGPDTFLEILDVPMNISVSRAYNLDSIKSVAETCSRLLKLIDDAWESRMDLIKEAYRFDEYFISQDNKTLTTHEFVPQLMVIRSYRFENFDIWKSSNPVEETDGDKYPVLKRFFPEHYV